MSIQITPLEVLQKYWKHNEFREWQEEVINSMIEWKDTIFLKRTWWWKSVCFNIPSIILWWTTIIISPLKELQKDQVTKLERLWISATYLNSSLDTEESKIRFENLMNWEYSMLFISPEKFASENFLQSLSKVDIKWVVVDECDMMIEEDWSFRKEFLNIWSNIRKLSKLISQEKWEEIRLPRHAFTATSSPKQTMDLIHMLEMNEDYNLFIWDIIWDNLNIEMCYYNNKADKEEHFLKTFRKIQREIKKTWDKCVIFCTSRTDVDELEKWLNWYKAFEVAWIHAWKSDSRRNSAMKKFSNWKVNTIIWTSVLSRWIDYSNIRYVIHYWLPWSFSSYVQEVGRWWRDWDDFYALLLACWVDSRTRNFMCWFNQERKDEFQKFKNFVESKEWCCHQKLNEYFWNKKLYKCWKCYLCKDEYENLSVF